MNEGAHAGFESRVVTVMSDHGADLTEECAMFTARDYVADNKPHGWKYDRCERVSADCVNVVYVPV